MRPNLKTITNSKLMALAMTSALVLQTSALLPPALLTPALAQDEAQVETALSPNLGSRWHGWAEVGGGKITDEDAAATLSVFAPVFQNGTSLLFTELGGTVSDGGFDTGHAALGFRQLQDNGINLGVWVGLDVANSDSDNTFVQSSGGFELLSEFVELRLNGHWPISDKKSADSEFAYLLTEGTSLSMVGAWEVPMPGIEAEIGRQFNLFDQDKIALGLFAGAYRFDDDDAYEAYTGFTARAELTIDDIIGEGTRFSAHYTYQDDDARGDDQRYGLRLRIPFGSSDGNDSGGSETAANGWNDYQDRAMTRRLESRHEILIGQSDEEGVEDALTETAFHRLAYVENGGSITDTSQTAGGNTLIIVNGEIFGGQEMQGDQTLLGGGETIRVRGSDSGTVLDFTAPGASAVLKMPEIGEHNLDLLGSNTHISGLSVIGNLDWTNLRGADGGIYLGSDKSNITITNVKLSEMDLAAIGGISNNSHITIRDVEIHSTLVFGIAFDEGNDHITIENVTIGASMGPDDTRYDIGGFPNNVVTSDSFGIGIAFEAENNYITIRNATIRNVASDAIHFVGNSRHIRIEDVKIGEVSEPGDIRYNIGDDGIQISDGNFDVTIFDATITNVADDGIAVGDDNENVTIDQVRIGAAYVPGQTNYDIGGDGIHIHDNNKSVTIRNSAIMNVGQFGIQIDEGNDDLKVESTTLGEFGLEVDIYSIEESGITLENDNDATFTNVSIHGVGFDAARTTEDGNILVFNNVTIGQVGRHVFSLRGGNTEFNEVTLNGPLDGGHAFVFRGDVHAEITSGFNNVDNIAGGATCQILGTSSFGGEIHFIDGSSLDQADCVPG